MTQFRKCLTQIRNWNRLLFKDIFQDETELFLNENEWKNEKLWENLKIIHYLLLFHGQEKIYLEDVQESFPKQAETPILFLREVLTL